MYILLSLSHFLTPAQNECGICLGKKVFFILVTTPSPNPDWHSNSQWNVIPKHSFSMWNRSNGFVFRWKKNGFLHPIKCLERILKYSYLVSIILNFQFPKAMFADLFVLILDFNSISWHFNSINSHFNGINSSK